MKNYITETAYRIEPNQNKRNSTMRCSRVLSRADSMMVCGESSDGGGGGRIIAVILADDIVTMMFSLFIRTLCALPSRQIEKIKSLV